MLFELLLVKLLMLMANSLETHGKNSLNFKNFSETKIDLLLFSVKISVFAKISLSFEYFRLSLAFL